MYIQRGCDPINKLVLGAVMPFDSRLQTVAKVKDNRIVGRYAGLYGKLDDSIGAVIVSQLIESGSRNEKAETVRMGLRDGPSDQGPNRRDSPRHVGRGLFGDRYFLVRELRRHSFAVPG